MKNKVVFFRFLFIYLYWLCGVAQHIVVDANTNIIASDKISIIIGGGTFVNDGVIENAAGTLQFCENVNYLGTGRTSTHRLLIDHTTGTSNLENRITVTGELQVRSGILNANDNLTLAASSTESAVVGPIFGAITGKVTVQRYISQGRRAFRFLSPGVTTDNFIKNNWQLHTHITGSSTGANGFDATAVGSPSLFTYKNQATAGSGWEAVSSTNHTNLLAMSGYRILIRGDRTDTLLTQASQVNMNAPLTLSATGLLTTGNVTFNSESSPVAINDTNNSITNGYSLIGNPYVNILNWDLLSKSGLTDSYYTWDPNMGTTAQRGRYVAYNTITGSTNSSSAINNYIQPGMAFFVKNSTLGTAGRISFTESDKIGANFKHFFKNATLKIPRLEVQVYQTDELAMGEYPIDSAVSIFDSRFTNDIENGDVTKLSTGTENIAFLNQSISFAIDARPVAAKETLVLLQLQQFIANKKYTFKVIFNNFNSLLAPYLVDNYLCLYTPLENNAATDVMFSTNNDVLSYDANRFKIVFQDNLLHKQNWDSTNAVIYPNPVVGNRFSIVIPSKMIGEISIKIINSLGQTVHQATSKAQNVISVDPKIILPSGIYYVQLESEKEKITLKTIFQ